MTHYGIRITPQTGTPFWMGDPFCRSDDYQRVKLYSIRAHAESLVWRLGAHKYVENYGWAHVEVVPVTIERARDD